MLVLNYKDMNLITDSVSAKGRYHEINEDSFVCNDRYVVIADGMGGEAHGDIASKIAVTAISSILNGSLNESCSEKDIMELTFSSILYADKKISEYVVSHPEADGMGTTVLLLIHIDRNIYIGWCGDSRCFYYTSSKGLNSLTTDHSLVQQLINEGKLSEEESFSHPDNNLITKFVGGGEETCKPDFISSLLDMDETLILCSDGLSGYCRMEEIEEVLHSSCHDNLAQRLLDLAIRKGSDDDITIVTLTTGVESKRNKGSMIDWLKKLVHS